ncbi:MAG: autotransporter-associated beta strand repeat-containing protein [Pirellulales bacterium]
MLRIDGGTLNSSEFILFRNGKFEFTITGGLVNHAGASQSISLGYTNNSVGTMNVVGGTLDNTGRDIIVRESGGTPNVNINLNGGTTITNAIRKANAAGTAVVNFNGGTLTPGSNGGTVLQAATGLTAYVNGAFGTFSGGTVIDTAGLNTTINTALLAPTGNGIYGLMINTAGSGYIGAPLVEITGGGGTGATAYAVVDLDPNSPTFGQVTDIVLTNPGVGYTSTPTITLLGGGGSGAAVSAAGTIANTSGGLTKNGAGTLTLSAVSTYTGGTTINAGTLALGVANALPNVGNITVAGGTLDMVTFSDTVAGVVLQSGVINGTTGVLTSTSAYDLRSGVVNAILAGSVGLNKSTLGTVTLGGANTFSGPVNVTGGTLEFSTSANLGNASATNTLGLTGATLRYTGVGVVDLGANRVLSLGGGTSTVQASASTGAEFLGRSRCFGNRELGQVRPGSGVLRRHDQSQRRLRQRRRRGAACRLRNFGHRVADRWFDRRHGFRQRRRTGSHRLEHAKPFRRLQTSFRTRRTDQRQPHAHRRGQRFRNNHPRLHQLRRESARRLTT